MLILDNVAASTKRRGERIIVENLEQLDSLNKARFELANSLYEHQAYLGASYLLKATQLIVRDAAGELPLKAPLTAYKRRTM